ncbi:MAG: acyl-CoA dehydrogenase family protein [Thermoplasmata archaeon]
MRFELTKEQEEFRSRIREFAQTVIAKYAEENDRTGKLSPELIKKMGEAGYLGLTVPKEYGGHLVDTISYAIAIEEMAKVCASTAISVAVHSSLGCGTILLYGSEELKRKYLPDLANGKKIGAFCLTEPNAGSDAGALQTTAKEDGEEYVLNGEKTFILNGPIASVYTVFALTNPELKTKGISAIVIEKNTPGFTISHVFDKLGVRAAETAKLKFENARVPKANLLGKEGEGFKIALSCLDGGRIGVAAQALGIAEICLESAISYAKQRVQFGQPISKNQGLQWMIAEMATRIEAARLLVYNAAYHRDMGRRVTKEASMAKLFASQCAVNASSLCMQIHGGYSYMKEYPIERYYRDAKITQIYEGTSEVQRIVISNQLGL